eukprot:PITA_07251
MQDSKPVKVPILVGVRLSIEKCPKTQEEEEDMSHVRYASAVGSLMYAMVCTRLDIAHAVGVLSKFMSKPGKEHWIAVKWVFRYLRGTSEYGLCYQGRPGLDRVLDIHGFVDARLGWRSGSEKIYKWEAIRIDYDSQSAIFLAKNPAYHSKAKHIDVQYHFVRDMIKDKKVLLVKLDTLKNTVDALTKSMSSEKFSWCRETMGISGLGK